MKSKDIAPSIPALRLQEVEYTYEGSTEPAIQGLSLTVAAGEWVAIIGASGSGKSTICRLMNGQLPRLAGGEREGVVHVYGFDPAYAHPGELVAVLGTLGQDPDAELVVGTTEDEIAFGPENMRVPADEIGRRIDRLTEQLELRHVRTQAIHRLSGGQRQRTALAAVLAMEPELLVLDEPAASLDPAGRKRVASMIASWHRDHKSLVTASARWDELADAADRVIVLDRGKIILDGKPSDIREQYAERVGDLFSVRHSLKQDELKRDTNGNEVSHSSNVGDPLTGGKRANEMGSSEISNANSNVPILDSEVTLELQAAFTLKKQPVPNKQSIAPSHTDDEPVVDIRQLSYTYPGTLTPVLHHINLQLRCGEMTLLCGVNGSGKTTLTRLLSGLLQPPTGTIYRGRRDIARDKIGRRAADTAYLMQHPDHQWVATTVWDECVFGLRAELGLRRREEFPAVHWPRVEQMLATIGLLDQREASPYSLSGGQKRLLAAAAQFLLDRPLYILDEPSSAADDFTISRLLEMCRAALKRGASLLIVTHEPELFRQDASRICTLEAGQMTITSL